MVAVEARLFSGLGKPRYTDGLRKNVTRFPGDKSEEHKFTTTKFSEAKFTKLEGGFFSKILLNY